MTNQTDSRSVTRARVKRNASTPGQSKVLATRAPKMAALIAEVRAARSMALRDSLFNKTDSREEGEPVGEGDDVPLHEAGEHDVNWEPHLLFTVQQVQEHRRGGNQLGRIHGAQSRKKT